jgi:arylsulfatase A-like enzyme/Tfp pilus assembly protein PilF
MIKLFLVLLFIVAAGWFLKSLFSDYEIKNLILISIDTCRPDYLSCYGYPRKTTPNIDNLAKKGTLFKNVIASVPLTLPSHSTMLTGTNPPYHGVHGNQDYKLGQSNVTLAEILHEHNFITGAIVSSFVMDSQFGLAQGFDTYGDRFENPFNFTGVDERKAEETSKFALEYLDKNRNEKFFLFLHYYDPHFIYNPPEPFASDFADNLYAGEIAYTDYWIGKVIEKLKKLGLYNSTLIIITSDHGEMLGEHGENTHGYYIYQSAIKVPLIIRLPGQTTGRRVDTPVGLVDIVPTIYSLLGINPSLTLHGQDISRFFKKNEDSEKQQRYFYCESMTPTQYGCTALLGVVNDQWKYIQAPRAELYDVKKDPFENHNLINEYPKRAFLLQEQLKSILQEQVYTARSDSKFVMDEESRKRLETLGYISAGSISEDFEFESDKGDPKDSLHLGQLIVRMNFYLANNELTKAEELIKEVFKERPEYILNYYYLGKIAFQKNDFNRSIKYYSKFLTAAGDNKNSLGGSHPFITKFLHKSYIDMGVACAELGDTKQAVIYYSGAIETDPDDPKTYYNIGNIYLNQDELEQARDYYEKALAIDPELPKAHYNLGNVLFKQGKIEEAVTHYSKAVELKPDWQEAQGNLGAAKMKLVEKLISSWNESLQKNPNQPELHKNLGMTYDQLGNYEKAVYHWREALQLEPNQPDVLNNLAWLLAAKQNTPFRNPEEAVRLAYRACELTNFEQPAFLDTLSVAYAAAGKFPDAVKYAKKAIDLARAANQEEIAAEIKKHLELFKRGQSFTETE